MIQIITAYTTEMDDIQDAVEGIFSQIDLNSLKKHSVGLIGCYYEFIDNGIVEAICAKLPFDVVGMTTMASASNGTYGMYRLTLTILTSDEISFSSAISAPLIGEYDRSIENAYQEARNKIPGDPSLMIAFLPIITNISGADILKTLDKSCNGRPIFGSLISDTSLDMQNGKLFRGGQCEKEALVLLLLHGPLQARFITKSIPERNVMTRQAIVTESENYLIKKIDGIPADEYFRSIGFSIAPGLNVTSMPLLVNYANSSDSVALGIYQWNEDGSALCADSIPVGTAIAVGDVDKDGIRETTEDALQKALAGGGSGMLIFPCVARYLMLSPESDDEIKQTIACLENTDIFYSLFYSGGEICPVYGKDGVLYNRFHNYTFTACVFS